MTDYEKFLEGKKQKAIASGFTKPKESMNPALFEWQKDIVYWALRKGRAALFEDCGLGKSPQSLEWAESVSDYTGKPVLIVCPLTVVEQFRREGVKFGFRPVTTCRTQADVRDGVNVTNYEMLSHFDADTFGGIVLDESSCLKDYTSSTRNEIIDMFRETEYKLSCTATPSPNDYMELGNQAEFLGVMTRTEMLATYFTHDGGETSKWRLKGHAEDRFWEWVATWSVVLTTPADLGYDATGYILPPKITTEHIVECEVTTKEGNYMLFAEVAKTLNERREARRNSLHARCQKAADLVAEKPDEQWLLWCDLNDESDELARLIPGSVEVRGSYDPEIKAERVRQFTDGEIRCLISKPSITGWGINWQMCHNMIFVGLSDSFEMQYQAVRRCWRYGQKETVYVHIITSDAEGAVKENVERKERQAQSMTVEMVRHTKEILEEEIRGTTRITIPYSPTVEMIVPEWVRSEVA